jgi:uncharacterized protein YjbJ (UPF0337 family)
MNKSHVTGGIDEAVGKVKESIGNATGNEKLANEGAAQQVKGAAKQTWGNVKDSANEASALAWTRVNKTEARAGEKSHELRDKVTAATEHMKNNIAHTLENFNKKQEDNQDDIRKAS